MIDKETFHPLNYIKLEEYSGSMDGMRYMLKRVPGEGEGADDRILVTIWPDPFGIHATSEEKKTTTYVALTTEGVDQAADWLNEQYLSRKAEWDEAKNWSYSGKA